MTPQNNLGVQTQIVAGARGFVGTCGSLAWLAPRLGVDTSALFVDPKFMLDPKRWTDPATVGWTFIATVSTLPERGPEGGQYGVVVSNPPGSLGKYRYLLFDCYLTEMNDDWGNTFYSEIDVVEKK